MPALLSGLRKVIQTHPFASLVVAVGVPIAVILLLPRDWIGETEKHKGTVLSVKFDPGRIFGTPWGPSRRLPTEQLKIELDDGRIFEETVIAETREEAYFNVGDQVICDVTHYHLRDRYRIVSLSKEGATKVFYTVR